VAFGGVEGGSGIERGQVGHELDRCLPLLAGEHTDAREEILIRQARGESEDVRVHVPVYHGDFRDSARALGSSGALGRGRFDARESFGAATA